jgi:hypothetical protein
VAHCKRCNRRKEKGHRCEVAFLSNGRIVHDSRLQNDESLQKKIEDGDVKVEYRTKAEPLKGVKERFGLRSNR